MQPREKRGFPSKQFRKYCIISSMQQSASLVPPLSAQAMAFLDFCRVEKGLAQNTLSAYRTDLERLAGELQVPERDASAEQLSGYVESLYGKGLSPRSVGRHVATLRNYYKFLAREGEISRDPSEFLASPKQWSTLPNYLNRDEVERLLAAPPVEKPN